MTTAALQIGKTLNCVLNLLLSRFCLDYFVLGNLLGIILYQNGCWLFKLQSAPDATSVYD